MESIENITSRITSNDLDVLDTCGKFLDERLEKERQRGESAERRANMILGVVGAVTAFMVFLSENVLNKLNDEVAILGNVFYAASAIWLARAVWYSMRAIRSQSRYRVSAESVFEFQSGSIVVALQKMLAAKYWEHKHSVQPNTERLFFVQRAQRALVVVIGLILTLGFLLVIEEQFSGKYSNCISISIFLALLVFWFFGDWVIEKSGMWNH